MNSEILNLRCFFALDYSQAEIRMLAELSGDPILLKQFQEGFDIHSSIGHELTGWSKERIKADSKTRQLVKNMVFAIIYGVSRDGLYDYVIAKVREQDGEKADLKSISRKKLISLYDAFFKKYKYVKRFIEKMREQAAALHYVDTLFGFRREITEQDDSRETFWGNQAVNSPIQGTAHQLILMAIALLQQKPKTYALLQTPLMEVHDALYFFVKVRDLPEAYKQGIQLLKHDVVKYAEKRFKYQLKVPLEAEAEAGFCLGSLVEYTGQPVAEFLKEWKKEHLEVEEKSWKKLLPEVSVERL